MAKFVGTISEFTKFIGGYARNKVQYITRSYRKHVGKCEEAGCTETTRLDAAHVKGKERTINISNILADYMEGGIVKIDLDEFEKKFIEAHNPINETIRILCKECHKRYDNTRLVHDFIPDDANEETEAEEGQIIENLVRGAKMSKANALKIINTATTGPALSSDHTSFSNIKSTEDAWWLEPSNDKFKTVFNLVLHDNYTNKLYLFLLRPSSIPHPELLFYQRDDRNRSSITIPRSEETFIDKKSGFDFTSFLVDTIPY